jgi:hypothetical protein
MSFAVTGTAISSELHADDGLKQQRNCRELTLGLEAHGLIQPELEERFRRHAHVLALIEHLDARSTRGADLWVSNCQFWR